MGIISIHIIFAWYLWDIWIISYCYMVILWVSYHSIYGSYGYHILLLGFSVSSFLPSFSSRHFRMRWKKSWSSEAWRITPAQSRRTDDIGSFFVVILLQFLLVDSNVYIYIICKHIIYDMTIYIYIRIDDVITQYQGGFKWSYWSWSSANNQRDAHRECYDITCSSMIILRMLRDLTKAHLLVG